MTEDERKLLFGLAEAFFEDSRVPRPDLLALTEQIRRDSPEVVLPDSPGPPRSR